MMTEAARSPWLKLGAIPLRNPVGSALFAAMTVIGLQAPPAWSQTDIQNAIIASTQKTPEVSTAELRRILDKLR